MSKDPWKNRATGMVCATCVAYVQKKNASEVEGSAEIGRCRKNAPTMKGFPVVFPDDWCGEHRLDETKLAPKKPEKKPFDKVPFVKPEDVKGVQIDKIKDLAEKIEKALKVEKYVGTGAGIEVMFDACNRPKNGLYIHPLCKVCPEHPINGGEGKCECE